MIHPVRPRIAPWRCQPALDQRLQRVPLSMHEEIAAHGLAASTGRFCAKRRKRRLRRRGWIAGFQLPRSLAPRYSCPRGLNSTLPRRPTPGLPTVAYARAASRQSCGPAASSRRALAFLGIAAVTHGELTDRAHGVQPGRALLAALEWRFESRSLRFGLHYHRAVVRRSGSGDNHFCTQTLVVLASDELRAGN